MAKLVDDGQAVTVRINFSDMLKQSVYYTINHINMRKDPMISHETRKHTVQQLIGLAVMNRLREIIPRYTNMIIDESTTLVQLSDELSDIEVTVSVGRKQ